MGIESAMDGVARRRLLRADDEQLIKPAARAASEMRVLRLTREGHELDLVAEVERREHRVQHEAERDAVGRRVGHACQV